ncbi:hypothetical protein AVEN_54459-1 [Araneus ventricosus]|uniref:Uncharacterized protein n=1 Tax=Araneus ventricosus TaxID=182803 RepID=A0A4Y2L6G6_ARAVE|nr:hypothetical protein AVEN_54459-1 [Araneus ventricosus]
MLYLLVELALSEYLIKEWERMRSIVQNKDNTNILGYFLEFLRSEVESDERLQFARSGIAKDQEFQKFKLKDKILTAAFIISSEKKRHEKNEKKCLICNKSFHNTSECFKAADTSLEEKKETLKKKGACFVCLIPGHNSKVCKTYFKAGDYPLRPAAPNDSDPDSSEDDESSIKIVPCVVSRAGRRVKIPNRLDL